MATTTSSKLNFAYWETLPAAAVRRTFWIFASLLLGFRLLVLAVVPLDLSGRYAQEMRAIRIW